jgi:8-oxo-dGTP pyrophosphatase MutT (NUDIX family)
MGDTTRWKPSVTVAAVIEQSGHYLLVEEMTAEGLKLNNPAGHLDPGQSLIDAVRRETLEETGWDFEPEAVSGIYLWKNPELEATFLRVAFNGHCLRHHPERRLDHGIVAAHWLTRAELGGDRYPLRTPMVLECIDDVLAGKRVPLEMLRYID